MLKDATINLRNFSTSQNESSAKWTIEIITKDKSVFKNKAEIKFK
ncbi:hypothetical protein [Pasteurella testudinis]|nr:hypothetical protein [Pasteurella testudinis]